MSIITVEEANAWADKSKLILDALDSELEGSIAGQVLSRVSQAYDTSSWLSAQTTPSLVKKIIAMLYVAWYYERAYSEDGGENTYSARLFEQAEALLEGIVTGALIIPADEADSILPGAGGTSAVGYEFGEPRFTMGQIW